MISYFVDTSVIIDFLRGKQHARTLLKPLIENMTSSYICLGELYEGAYRSNNQAYQEKLIEDYFHTLGFIYSIDKQVAIKFGELRAKLKEKGMTIEDVDLIIAATCLVYDLELVTYNTAHFARIPGLQLLGIQVSEKM